MIFDIILLLDHLDLPRPPSQKLAFQRLNAQNTKIEAIKLQNNLLYKVNCPLKITDFQ